MRHADQWGTPLCSSVAQEWVDGDISVGIPLDINGIHIGQHLAPAEHCVLGPLGKVIMRGLSKIPRGTLARLQAAQSAVRSKGASLPRELCLPAGPTWCSRPHGHNAFCRLFRLEHLQKAAAEMGPETIKLGSEQS